MVASVSPHCITINVAGMSLRNIMTMTVMMNIIVSNNSTISSAPMAVAVLTTKNVIHVGLRFSSFSRI